MELKIASNPNERMQQIEKLNIIKKNHEFQKGRMKKLN